MSAERDESYPFDWVRLVSSAVHPSKVAIVEAMAWIGEPLSANLLEHVFEGQYGLSLLSYHLKRLAEMGVIEEVGTRPARGATEHFFFFAGER